MIHTLKGWIPSLLRIVLALFDQSCCSTSLEFASFPSFLALGSWLLVRFFLRLACLLFSCFSSTFFVGWSLFPYFPLCCLYLWRAPRLFEGALSLFCTVHTSHNILLGFLQESKSPPRAGDPANCLQVLNSSSNSLVPGSLGAMQGEKLTFTSLNGVELTPKRITLD